VMDECPPTLLTPSDIPIFNDWMSKSWPLVQMSSCLSMMYVHVPYLVKLRYGYVVYMCLVDVGRDAVMKVDRGYLVRNIQLRGTSYRPDLPDLSLNRTIHNFTDECQ
jgi:hypothetical protein